MRPYMNIKLTEWADVADIRSEGRRTRVGGRDYFKGARRKKAVARRHLRRIDRAADRRSWEKYDLP